VSKWSRLLKPFSSLFGGSGGLGKTPEPSPRSTPQIPRQGLGGLVARATDRFRKVVPPPIQEQPLEILYPKENNFDGTTDEGFDAVEILGRDATYDEELWNRVQESALRVVSSSNVYSYAWEPDHEGSINGVLYVTFLHWEPGMKQDERTGPGPTYAYYDFPRYRFDAFNKEAEDSAGRAVWDFCRVRGSRHAHQHRYRLVAVSGEYVPRKATARGFKRRTLIRAGMSPGKRRMLSQVALLTSGKSTLGELENNQLPRSFRRSTLADEEFGTPDRGEPNRGRPNRGR
jgi:hypothetical protein